MTVIYCKHFRIEVVDKFGKTHQVVDNRLYLDKKNMTTRDLKRYFPDHYKILSIRPGIAK